MTVLRGGGAAEQKMNEAALRSVSVSAISFVTRRKTLLTYTFECGNKRCYTFDHQDQDHQTDHPSKQKIYILSTGATVAVVGLVTGGKGAD